MNEMYVTGVVIPNGIADHEGDVLNKVDIKKIFTKYLNRDTDTMHTRIRNEGVDVLANWISEADMVIRGKTAPAGSWLATFKITNAEIIKSIKSGKLAGLSLGSVSDIALTQKYWFINKSINYKDLDDTEEVIPLFISFVDKPSNGFGFEIMDYDVYINKRINDVEVEKMTNENQEIKPEDEKLSVSAWERIVNAFSINKSVTEPAELKEEITDVDIEKKEKEDESEPKDISNTELLEKIPEAVSNGIVNAFEKMKVKKDEAPQNIEKSEEKSEEKEKTEEKEAPKKDDEKSEEKEKKDKEVDINKRATSKEAIVDVEPVSTFYERTGRDMFGKKIRN